MSTIAPPQHLDVLVVGAGLSGIAAAWHLQAGRPGTSYAILEAREASGGTWDLFRYPGIRSDSDLSTFAYAFKPWTGDKAIADGPEILRYIRETAAESGIEEHIRYGHKVLRASWSTDEARWTVEAEHDGEVITFTAGWLFCASGYYRYDEGFSPVFPGLEDFEGQVIHPQHWPEDFDATGKRIVVIGSGATAVTLIPALVEQGAGQVTQLQRSPSYVLPLPAKDVVADKLRGWFGDSRGHQLTRKKNIWQQRKVYAFCQKHPKLARRIIRGINAKMLPEHVDVDTHFNPSYDPWDQRLCAVPNGDLFKALRSGSADIVTDQIDTFTAGGVRLASGRELEADVIVTATGLNMLLFGGIELEVDGKPVVMPETLAYKGFMGSDVPNFSFAIGYTNSSWTLKVDLVCEQLVRILRHMDEYGYDVAVAIDDEPGRETRPLMDFSAGYVKRSLHLLPRQGTSAPWQLPMDYAADVKQLRGSPVDDGVLHFSRSRTASRSDVLAAA